MTPDHIAVQVHNSQYGRAEFVGLPGKALTRDDTIRRRFVGYAANWLHCMVLHGRHEKTPVRCICSQLVALHGVPRTLLLLLMGKHLQ